MSNNSNYTWTTKNILDDIGYQEEDAKTFRDLLHGPKKTKKDEESVQQMAPGTILHGRIVEIGKDYVVVDVGLKSEGLVPISEFSDPSELVLDGDIEVYLDQPEDEHGQVVLSKEKASRQRQSGIHPRSL